MELLLQYDGSRAHFQTDILGNSFLELYENGVSLDGKRCSLAATLIVHSRNFSVTGLTASMKRLVKFSKHMKRVSVEIYSTDCHN